MTKLTIRQYKSAIGSKIAARETLASLGLRRPGNVVEREDSPSLRGQLRKIGHLVTVEDSKGSGVEGAEPLRGKR
jgi:large subunit ribosomal protein L30